jgi:hypothetical protein
VKPPMYSARGNEVASKGTLYYPVEESGWQGQNLITAIPQESYEKTATASSPCEGMCAMKISRPHSPNCETSSMHCLARRLAWTGRLPTILTFFWAPVRLQGDQEVAVK